ncbi:MAG: hydroxymethylbilane synthase [bacterium]
MKRSFKIGTRGSKLSLVQANEVRERLLRACGERFDFEIQIIKTTGDKMPELPLAAPLHKGLFTKELETALRAGTIDLAVHSCKDLPTELEDDLCIAAVLPRLSVRDVLILKEGMTPTFSSLPAGSAIFTSSPRRELQWLARHPQTRVLPIRGNIDTRLQKLRNYAGNAGLLLAEAGILRLQPSLDGLRVFPLSLEEMLPSPGQGALAIEALKSNAEACEAAASVNDVSSEKQVRAERAFLHAMGGGCRAPIAAYARPVSDNAAALQLDAIVFKGAHGLLKTMSGEEPEILGKNLAKEFLGDII